MIRLRSNLDASSLWPALNTPSTWRTVTSESTLSFSCRRLASDLLICNFEASRSLGLWVSSVSAVARTPRSFRIDNVYVYFPDMYTPTHGAHARTLLFTLCLSFVLSCSYIVPSTTSVTCIHHAVLSTLCLFYYKLGTSPHAPQLSSQSYRYLQNLQTAAQPCTTAALSSSPSASTPLSTTYIAPIKQLLTNISPPRTYSNGTDWAVFSMRFCQVVPSCKLLTDGGNFDGTKLRWGPQRGIYSRWVSSTGTLGVRGPLRS